VLKQKHPLGAELDVLEQELVLELEQVLEPLHGALGLVLELELKLLVFGVPWIRVPWMAFGVLWMRLVFGMWAVPPCGVLALAFLAPAARLACATQAEMDFLRCVVSQVLVSVPVDVILVG